MEVIDGAAPADGAVPAGPVCVLVRPSAPERAVAAARWLGADTTAVAHALAAAQRRPVAYAEGPRISVVAVAAGEDGAPAPVHLHVGERGLLVVCPQPLAGTLAAVVSTVDADPRGALVAVLVALAEQSTAALESLSVDAETLDRNTVSLVSGTERRDVSRLRHRLFAWQQIWMAHHLICAPDGVLADAVARTVDAAARRRLRYASAVFEASGAAAAQLYALLGDVLSRQSAVISERLTLVTVIFLPLTVSTGFFGMNFGWLTAHIGSVAAFVVLGLAVPAVLVAATVAGARRFTGD